MGEGAATITGSLPSLPLSVGLWGVPPLSWMIDVPVIPGILPIISRAGLHRFCATCGANIPEKLDAQLEALGGDEEAERAFGIAYASRQCEELLAAGAPGIHFFVLNRAASVRAVLGALLAARPWERAATGAGLAR